MTITNGSPDFATLKRECDVCIVGAGIVGMITALLLKKQGIDVHVYDRQGAVYPLPRAIVLSDDSLRTCVAAGLGSEIQDLIKPGSGTVEEICWRDANKEVLARIETGKLGASGRHTTSTFSQPIMESAVALRCESSGVPIFRNWEVKSYEAHTVEGEHEAIQVCFQSYKGKNCYNPKLEVQAKWLIGADGANSTIRKLAGIGQEDYGLCFDWLIIDTLPTSDSSNWPWMQLCDPVRPMTMVASGPRRFRFEFMRLPNETEEELCEPKAVWNRLAQHGVDSSNCEIERAVVYRFRSLQAERYCNQGQVAILGDAAHQLPPFTGQGLNSGIRDAAALAWRLAMILGAGARPDIIGSYNLERKAHVKSVMERSIALGQPICETDPVIAKAMHDNMRQAYNVSKAPEPHFESPLVEGGFFDQANHGGGFMLRSGKLRPKPEDGNDHEEYRWRLLDFGKESQVSAHSTALLASLKATATRIDNTVDMEGDYAEWFSQHGNSTYALVRPDAFVYGFAKNAQALEKMLVKVITALGIGGNAESQEAV